jgi:hypothetical protein
MTAGEASRRLQDHVDLCPRCLAGANAKGLLPYSRMCSRAKEIVDLNYRWVTEGGEPDGDAKTA